MQKEKIYFFIFLFLFLTVYFLLHFYIYKRICKGFNLALKYRIFIKIIFFIFASSFILAQSLIRKYNIELLLYISSVWFGIISITFTIFIFKDIIQIFFPSKSKFLTFSAVILSVIFSMAGFLNNLRKPVLKEVRIKSKKISSEIKNFTIIHLSDLHLGPLTSKKWLDYVVCKVNEQEPDLIVITGDLIDMDLGFRYEDYFKILKNLKSKYGIYATTGNHEFYAGIENFLKIAKKLNIKVLKNQKITIKNKIDLIGIDDDTIKHYTGETVNLEKIIKESNLKNFLIVLSHKPKNFEKAVDLGIDLQLSGHIHSGQIPPLSFPLNFLFKYFYGLYKYKNSFIYVTSGTGTWGPPLRLFSQKEIVKIILEK